MLCDTSQEIACIITKCYELGNSKILTDIESVENIIWVSETIVKFHIL